MLPNVLTVLADFAGSNQHVSKDALRAARRTILDTIGAAAGGVGMPGARASRNAATAIWGSGQSAIWFAKERLLPTGAAFVNATSAAALDLDDGHRAAAGHPAAAIVPAVLALAARREMTGDRLLSALVIGYEVAVRAAASRDINNLRTTDTGLWCGYGVAAAVGCLLGLAPARIAHAMAIAGQTAPGQSATGWTRLGHTVKEGIAWATANGLQSAYLAAAGHTGPIDLLDETSIYDRERLLEGLGETWAIEGAYFKRYSCCRWAHAAIDGSLLLQERLGVSSGEIDEIVIETFDRALMLPNQISPLTHEAAQYSIPFCISVGLTHGKDALLPLEDRHISDKAVVELAGRIRLKSSPRYATAFPVTTPATVTVRSKDKNAVVEILNPKGEPKNPISDAELGEKFARLVGRASVSPARAEAILNIVANLGCDAAPSLLVDALCNSS